MSDTVRKWLLAGVLGITAFVSAFVPVLPPHWQLFAGAFVTGLTAAANALHLLPIKA